MSESRRIIRRIRKEIDEPGLRASVAADVNIAIATGASAGSTTSSSTHSTVHVQQGRSARAAPDPEPKERP
ncbi:MAG: hypothetical protein WD794_17325 [Mycobacteriales bacterium]